MHQTILNFQCKNVSDLLYCMDYYYIHLNKLNASRNYKLLDNVEQNMVICQGEQINYLPMPKAEELIDLRATDKSQHFVRI